MGGPGTPGFVAPRGEDWINRELADLRRQVRENAAARSTEQTAIGQGGLRSADFNGTGLENPGTAGWMIGRTPGGESWLIMNGRLVITGDTSIAGMLDIVGRLNVTGPMTISGDTDVTGSLDVTGPMNVGGTLDVGGTMDVTGDAVFSGNLSVPNGSIDNAALASPLVIVPAAPATGSGWAVGTTMGAKAASSIAVPAGFSRATVTAWANMHFMDSSPNGGWVRASIAGNGGAEMGGLANLQLGQGATHTVSLTGLSGGTIDVSCDVRASVATGGMSGRIAQITAVAYFQR